MAILLLAGCNSAVAAMPSGANNTRNFPQPLYSVTSAADAGLNTGILYGGPTSCVQIIVAADGGTVAGDATINEILVDGTVVPLYSLGASSSTENGVSTFWGAGHANNGYSTTNTFAAGFINSMVPPEFSVTTKAKASIPVRLDILSCY
jgi:hypothetical protein